VTRSTSPAISSVGIRGWAEETGILIEVYAVEGHLGAVIQSGPAGGESLGPVPLSTLYCRDARDADLEVRYCWREAR
jgi:hypothetical protein